MSEGWYVAAQSWMSAWRCCEKPKMHTSRRFERRGARARVRAAFLREALRIKLLRARRRRAGRRVAGFVIMAQARLARRHAGRAVRSDTLLSTVKSIQRGDFPTRRAAAARAAPSTPRLVSAARVGPVVYGLLLTFRGDGYG